MSKEVIYNIVSTQASYGKAISEDALFALLPFMIERNEFTSYISELVHKGHVVRKRNMLMTHDFVELVDIPLENSRRLFECNRFLLRVYARLPWMRFMGLTGANAFESCKIDDDIDLFVVTAKNRLWLVYLLLVVMSKLCGKRSLFCFNYLIEETSLNLEPQGYYAAVQFSRMKPLFNADFKRVLANRNAWLFRFLPNAGSDFFTESFYRLRNDFPVTEKRANFIFDKLNRLVYRRYAMHLKKKYPQFYGKGILLAEGKAKLHRVDHSKMYDVQNRIGA